MLHNLFLLVFFILQSDGGPSITSPVDGEVLKDIVPITGITAVEGFQFAELSFTYDQEPIETWFVITSLVDPVTEGLLTQWDTKSITDGDYHLRLQVRLQDGSIKEFLVRDLKIRNYTTLPVEQSATIEVAGTLAINAIPDTTQAESVVPSLAPVIPSPNSTPVPLLTNPAELDRSKVFSILKLSVFVTMLAFVLLGLLFRSRRNR